MSLRLVSKTREARERALNRMSRSRNPFLRNHATYIVDFEPELDHYRWVASAPISVIANWASWFEEELENLGGAA